MSRSARAGRSAELNIGGRCELQCALCDCRDEPTAVDVTERVLEGGGRRLLLRGAPLGNRSLPVVIGRARDAGFTEIVVRTSAVGLRRVESVRTLTRLGVTTALVPIFSERAGVHDRIAGRDGALEESLAGIRLLATHGIDIEIEAPILSPRLQRLDAVVDLARDRASHLSAVRFFVSLSSVPRTLAPPPWGQTSAGLARAILRCREIGARVNLGANDAIPLCALAGWPAQFTAFWFDPRSSAIRPSGCSLVSVCARCAVRDHCPGVAEPYLEANGEVDLQPYAERPGPMYEQRTTPRRVWTDEQRRAAAGSRSMVIRPTVHCNQDCLFCSSNETALNSWADAATTYRAIARAARRGVRYLSLSGGEPTLSRDLVGFVRVAARCGIPRIELVTNGVLLDSQRRVLALREAGLTDAFVSLHAHNEDLSRRLTQRAGDFASTIKAIDLLIDHGVRTVVNHVITTQNYPYLTEFVEFMGRRFKGRTLVSFTFVTPQFKALEHLELMPRISEVMPHLRVAMRRCLDLGQAFRVGARQGIPPCFLGEFEGWSDILRIRREAIAEDEHQKRRDPACADCRYGAICTGLWKPYVARHGLGELRPVPGGVLSEQEIEALDDHCFASAWDSPMAFADLPDLLRNRAAELETVDPPDPADACAEVHQTSAPKRTRPLRIVIAGSSRRARQLVRAAGRVRGLSIDAVVSPHVAGKDLRDFAGCPAYSDAGQAFQDMRPEAVIIAAATRAHAELVRLAVDHEVPVLVEKPLAGTLREAEDLADRTAGVLVVPAHNVLFAAGLDVLWHKRPDEVEYRRRLPPTAPDTPRRWRRDVLSEMLYHVLVVTGRACGGGRPRVVDVGFRGEVGPESLDFDLEYRSCTRCTVSLAFDGAEDDLVVCAHSTGSVPETISWRRTGAGITIEQPGSGVTSPSPGNELEMMLSAFRDSVFGASTPFATVGDAVDVMGGVSDIVGALEEGGAPIVDSGGRR